MKQIEIVQSIVIDFEKNLTHHIKYVIINKTCGYVKNLEIAITMYAVVEPFDYWR